MKILFLSQRFLFPMDTGGKIRTGNILRQLCKKAEVTVISNVESPKDDPYLGEMEGLCSRFVPVSWRETERYSLRFYLELAFKKLSRYPVSVLNDYSEALVKAIRQEVAEHDYDLLICDFLQSSLNFESVSGVPTLLFQHNVEAQITQRHVEKARNPVSRLFWKIQHARMLRHEQAMCHRFDGVIAVSDSDKQLMEEWYGARNVHTIPTGVDIDFFSPVQNADEQPQLVFTGSMDWLPNEDAMIHFIDTILPSVQGRMPETRLVVVGRRPSPVVQKLAHERTDIELTGWVDDTRPYIAASSVYIVPIRIGGGTRMKIYEAMAMGKALISTTVGAEGLPLQHDEHFINADKDEEFAEQIVRLLQSPAERRRLGDNARAYVEANFSWDRVAERFLEVCETVATSTPDEVTGFADDSLRSGVR